MHRLRLSTLLMGVNVTLLLLAVAGVATVAVRLLQRLADEQALARVAQTGLIVRQQIGVTGEAMHSSARLLSERPTLRRLIAQHDQAGLSAFLTQFAQTDQLDSIVIMERGQLLAQAGVGVPWNSILTRRRPDDAYFLQQAATGEPLLLGAWSTLPGDEQYTVGALKRLDQRFASTLSSELGLAVMILPSQPEVGVARTAQEDLRRQALTTSDGASARLIDRDIYQAAVPLHAPTGELAGIIVTELPTANVVHSVAQLIRTLLLLTLSLAIIAAGVSFALGRRLGRPLSALTDAAASMGHGDLLTPLPVVPSAEIGTLATTLEEMRQRLLRLTNDLRYQQAEAQAIVTGIIEGVFSVDSERRFRYLNPQAARMLGTTPEAALGRFCGDVLRPQGHNGVRPCAEHCPIIHARFRSGARATEHLVLADGRRRTVIVTSAPGVDGLQVQVLRDETEVEAARRARDAILANISHEFRTPLSAQLASIELLLDQLPDLTTNEIGQLVRSQQRGTLRLTQLIDNLLESARIEAGHQAIRRQPVALDEVIEAALELTQPLLDQQAQSVMIDLPYPMPTIRGDAGRLTQVFVNLLGNAHKFAPKESVIDIGGIVDRSTITLWVQDQGPGLPVTNGQALFERFVRTSEEEPEQGGVGLGLWLVKSIVERHGGRVTAESTPDGTRMSVSLPREAVDENLGR